MTTKHVTDESVRDIDTADLVPAREATEHAEDASRQLLAKARYDAFRLMTEARDEAETILDEARAEATGTRSAAEITSGSMIEEATARAAAIVESAHEEAATIVAGAHRKAGEETPPSTDDALEAEHKALSERVSTLRTLADQLEDRFAALARTAAPPPRETPAPDSPTSATLDYSPSVAPPPKVVPKDPNDFADEAKESFYNRRSANLPRLGDDGGRSALDMTRAMRQSLETD